MYCLGDSRHLVLLCVIFGFSLQKVTQPAFSTKSEQMIIVYRWAFKVKVYFDSVYFELNVSIKLLLLKEQTYITKFSLIPALPTSAGVLVCLLVNSSIILTLKSFWLQRVTGQEPARKADGGMFCGHSPQQLAVAYETDSLLPPNWIGFHPSDGYQPWRLLSFWMLYNYCWLFIYHQ